MQKAILLVTTLFFFSFCQAQQTNWYRDADGDGYGKFTESVTAPTKPAGYTDNASDCNDANATIHTWAPELLDGLDNNCNGQVDENYEVYRDADNDGYGNFTQPKLVAAGKTLSGYALVPGDCNDNNAAINPGATEILGDGIDNDCNGVTDLPPLRTFYRDADHDGYGVETDTVHAVDAPVGYTGVDQIFDCNDNDRSVNPEACDINDGKDNDCDGLIDEESVRFYRDRDYDGKGDARDTGFVIARCELDDLAGLSTNNLDCDDLDDDVEESCPTTIWYGDADNDGYGDPNLANSTTAETQPDGYVANNRDCNDIDANINPDAVEVCDGRDNNCDGIVDGACSGPKWYLDFDGDGYGDPREYIQSETQPDNYVANNTDCNDGDGDTHPGVDEIAGDGIDNDCDGQVDEPCKLVITCPDNITVTATPGLCTYTFGDDSPVHYPTTKCANTYYYVLSGATVGRGTGTIYGIPLNVGITKVMYVALPADEQGKEDSCSFFVTVRPNGSNCSTTTWYRDADGDGFGNPLQTKVAPTQPRGYVSNNLDCDDKNKTKGGPEVCDGRDNDCDGIIDNGFDKKPFYSDFDGDGYGTPKRMKMACVAPPRYVSNSQDCNDDVATVYPGAPELCDGRDNDCDGTIDEGLAQQPFYWDGDGDGYGFVRPVYACAAPRGYITIGGDCNDENPAIHPGATEHCDGVDEDCDGVIDNGFPQKRFYKDGDGDGWGSNSNRMAGCAPKGYVARNGDCNDANAAIHPGATEIKGNRIDDNCNGTVDETLSTITQNKGSQFVPEEESIQLRLLALPNPSTHYFTLRIQSNNNSAAVVQVVDALGRVVETRQTVAANSTLQIGHAYRPGVYVARVVQNGKQVDVKLLKTAQ